jgi:5'-nucleotidase
MGPERPLILACNDDGIGAAGLRALVESLAPLGDVVVVAPDRERSAAGHSLTLTRPLRVVNERPGWYGVDGTPTDCVALAMTELLPRKPDLVVAGINHGWNLGDDVTYSGTVAIAMEATLKGVPAFAVSSPAGREGELRAAADCACRLAREVLRRGLPHDTLLNVNVPDRSPEAVAGWLITRQGRRVYSESVVRNVDPRGLPYYWIGGTPPVWKGSGGTDDAAVRDGWISVTPLHLDLTNERAIAELAAWGVFPEHPDGHDGLPGEKSFSSRGACGSL